MALTKISRGLLSTGISDSSDATAITIDSSEKVGLNGLSAGDYWSTSNQLVLGDTGSAANGGMSIVTATNAIGQIYFADGTSGDARYRGQIQYSHVSDAMDFATAASFAMRIASGGGVAIGTTTPDGVSNLTVKSQNATAGQEFVSLHHQASSGTIYFMSFMTGSGNGSDVGYITFSGTTGAFAAASDISLKENVRDLPEGLDVITQLKPRLFDWKEEGKGKDQVGFIAQEVEEIKPEWVHQKEDIKLISTNLPDTIPYLIKAIQEQQTQIEALQSEINTLKGGE